MDMYRKHWQDIGGVVAMAILVLPLFLVGGVVVPQQMLKDEQSPYRFTAEQVGPYGRDGHDGGDTN